MIVAHSRCPSRSLKYRVSNYWWDVQLSNAKQGKTVWQSGLGVQDSYRLHLSRWISQPCDIQKVHLHRDSGVLGQSRRGFRKTMASAIVHQITVCTVRHQNKRFVRRYARQSRTTGESARTMTRMYRISIPPIVLVGDTNLAAVGSNSIRGAASIVAEVLHDDPLVQRVGALLLPRPNSPPDQVLRAQ